MDTLAELDSALQSDLSVVSGSSFYDIDKRYLAINRAYRKSGMLFRWAQNEKAKKVSAEAGLEYYLYPTNWRPDSIWKLSVDGQDYGKPLRFEDYLYEKDNSIPSGYTYMWANYGTRFFIYPTPTADGEFNIKIHGTQSVPTLVNTTDTTIFSYNMRECNDAVVMEAKAILQYKGRELAPGQFISSEAKGILAVAWSKIKQENDKYIKSQSMYGHNDFFKGVSRKSTNLGNFDV